jgi:predicted GNAT family N-acyltransferase
VANRSINHQAPFRIDSVAWERAEDAICSVRRTVFVGGPGQPAELKLDGLDPGCWHALAWSEGGRPIGTARLHPAALEGEIGYMAVLPSWQGCGVGRAMLRFLIGIALGQDLSRLSVSARVAAIAFFEKDGFRATGSPFDDSGIPHRKMTLLLRPSVNAGGSSSRK